MHKLHSRWVVAAATLGATSPLLAQELAEVTVTAQRRETALQSTPLAVTAFTPEELDQRQITETADLMRAVPNLNVNNNVGSGTANAYWLRGSGVGETLVTFDPPVGTYVDEVFDPRVNAAQIQLLDVDRVEVLRGPQGTLFGRNTTAGAVSIVTRKPEPEFAADVEAGFGRFSRKTLRGSVNAPLGESLSSRLSAYWVDSDGSMRSLTNGERFNGSSSWGVRGALRLRPSDVLDWTVSGTYVDADELAIGTAVRVGTNPVDDGVAGSVISGDLFRNYTDLRPCRGPSNALRSALAGCVFNVAKKKQVISNLQWNTAAATVNFITGYQDTDVANSADYIDNHPQRPLGAFVGPHFYIVQQLALKSFSQEIKASGNAFSDRASVVAGLYYMREDNDSDISDVAGANPVPIALRDLQNETRTLAAYAQADTKLTDRLTLTTGLRFTNEEKTIDVFYANPLAGSSFTNDALIARGYPTKLTENQWTPKVGLQYQATPEVMLYVSATNGFKSGGWNARVNAPQFLVAFGPEKVWSYEVGLRADWLERRLRTNVTAFHADYRDRQIATTFPGTTTFVTTNAGDTPIQGIEIEATAAPLDNLRLFLTAGIMDGELDDPSAAAIATGLGGNTIPIQMPDWTLLGGFTWTVPLASAGRVVIGADASAKDMYYSDWANLPNQQVKQPTLLNASIAYRAPEDRWGVALECKNCTDEEWVRQTLFNVAYPGDPLQWGVRVNYRFD